MFIPRQRGVQNVLRTLPRWSSCPHLSRAYLEAERWRSSCRRRRRHFLLCWKDPLARLRWFVHRHSCRIHRKSFWLRHIPPRWSRGDPHCRLQLPPLRLKHVHWRIHRPLPTALRYCVQTERTNPRWFYVPDLTWFLFKDPLFIHIYVFAFLIRTERTLRKEIAKFLHLVFHTLQFHSICFLIRHFKLLWK